MENTLERIDKINNTVYLYDIDWKYSGVSELEVDVSKKRDREHLEDFLRNWFIDEYNELPLSYEIKDYERFRNN